MPPQKAIPQRRVEEAQSKGYEYIFTNPRTGTRYNDVKRGFREALDEAGIEDFRFHDLRHTFGSMAVEGGASLTALRDMLGHTSLETTNRYAHSTEEGRRRVVEAQEFGHKTVTKDIMARKRQGCNKVA